MFTSDLYDLREMWEIVTKFSSNPSKIILLQVDERSGSELVLDSRSLETQIPFEVRCHTRMTALCNIQVYNVLHWKSLQSLDHFLGIDPNLLSWLTTCLHILPQISSNISFFARLFTLYMVHLRSRPCCKSAWRFR